LNRGFIFERDDPDKIGGSEMYKDATGIIIIEGNKKFDFGLQQSDKTIIEHTKNLMSSLFERVIIISNDPDKYKFLGIEIFPEFYKSAGPLSSIHAGLFHTETKKNFITASDFYLMKKEMIEYLVDYRSSALITLAKAEDEVQKLAGVYLKKCFIPAEEILKKHTDSLKPGEKKECRLSKLIDTVGVQLISAEILPFYSSEIFFRVSNYQDAPTIKEKVV
jgi:molybdenum cofactor guanylyltransferase